MAIANTVNGVNFPLAGKVAVVTGAGRGIGRAIALGYAQAGAALCCAARTSAEIEQTAQTIRRQGGQALAVTTDVTDLVAVERMMAATVAAFGGIDILVINAGVSLDRRTVEESVPEDWRATLDANLFGAYNCAKAAISYLKSRGAGKIITIGSGMGRRGAVGGSAYACSKAALWMLTRVLAQEVWQYNISVNELIPGPVETAMTSDPAGRHGPAFATDSEWQKQPEDVVPLALFLATQPEIGPTAQSFSLMRRDNG
jgi:3-oxoacyl-[acyl-carrier protein] reductase